MDSAAVHSEGGVNERGIVSPKRRHAPRRLLWRSTVFSAPTPGDGPTRGLRCRSNPPRRRHTKTRCAYYGGVFVDGRQIRGREHRNIRGIRAERGDCSPLAAQGPEVSEFLPVSTDSGDLTSGI